MTSTASSSAAPTAAGVRRSAAGRFELSGIAFLWVLLFGPVVAIWVLSIVAIPLVLITAGILLLWIAVPAMAALAGVHRRLAGRALGEDVPASYAPVTYPGVLGRLQTWMRDPARWRDLLWAFVDFTAGFVLSVLALVPIAGFAWWLAFPLVFGVTPDGIFDTPLGFLTIDTFWESFYAWIAAGAMALLWWFVTPHLVRAKARMDANLLSRGRTERLERRVQDLQTSRAESVDFSAAELRRIERDLHDGAQARLVALGMNLGLADELMDRDPEQARKLLADARSVSTAALGDLRSVVRSIHPPVLADRGLAGAVQALAMDLPLPVTLTVTLPGRPPAPIESAMYFAVAECLANVVKHARAKHAWITVEHRDGDLVAEVGDDGQGGADSAAGTGMLGVMRRLSAFDGTMAVSSPAGGPTLIRLEVPCELSSGKTTPSSGTA